VAGALTDELKERKMKLPPLAFSAMFLRVVVSGAGGSVLSMDLDTEISGAQAPEGLPPWLNATFDDGGSPGLVTMTLTAINLTATEFVSVWLFNLDEPLDPANLLFSAPAKTGSFVAPTIYLSADTYKADGDGFFDMKFEFSNSDGADNRFGAGDAAVYTVTGIATLRAASFDVDSSPGGGNDVWDTVAKVQGVDGEGSGWTAPEPVALGLLLAGSLGLLRRRNR